MKTADILLDLQFSLSKATREPSKGNAIYPIHMVIKGLKFTLVIEFVTRADGRESYISDIKEFFVFDPDNLPIDNVNNELVRDWIVKCFLYVDPTYYKESKYKDFNDWQKNSPLVELGIEVKQIEQ